jgi:hypothetical protein
VFLTAKQQHSAIMKKINPKEERKQELRSSWINSDGYMQV